MTPATTPATPDAVACPQCGQYSHTLSEGQLAGAFMHFQALLAHPLRGHPLGQAFDDRTQDAAQVLMAAAMPPRLSLGETVEQWQAEWLDSQAPHWGDRIEWKSAAEIARRLDQVIRRTGAEFSPDGAGTVDRLSVADGAAPREPGATAEADRG